MKAVVAAFNQEKSLVGAFSVITNLRMQFGCNFLKHYIMPWLHGVQVLTKDSVTVSVDAVVYYRVSNATVSI